MRIPQGRIVRQSQPFLAERCSIDLTGFAQVLGSIDQVQIGKKVKFLIKPMSDFPDIPIKIIGSPSYFGHP
jgi:hypothetical protein